MSSFTTHHHCLTLRIDYYASPLSPEAQLIEDLNKAREEVENKLKNAPPAAAASTPVFKLSLMLADNVLGLLLKHSQSRGRVGELERSVAHKLKDQEDRLEDTAMILKWQDEVIRGLATSLKVLEGLALGVRRLISLIASTNRASPAR